MAEVSSVAGHPGGGGFARAGESWARWYPWLLYAAFVAGATGVDCWRLYTWRATTLDLGWYSQALWLIGHGRWRADVTVLHYPLLADAAAYVVYPMAAIYRWAGQPGLFVTQALALGSGIIGVAWLVSRDPHAGARRWVWPLLYAVYPPVLGSAVFDWHPDVFFIPAFFLVIWAIETRRVAAFVLGLLLASATKDVGAAVTAVLAVPLALRGLRGWALAALAVGGGVAALDVLVVMPALYPPGLAVWPFTYGWLGAAPGQALAHLLSDPALIGSAVWRPQVLWYLALLLWPLGILPPLAGGLATGYLWPAAAVLGFNMLSAFAPQTEVFNQYSLAAVPFLMASSLSPARLGPKWLWVAVPAAAIPLIGLAYGGMEAGLMFFSRPPVGNLVAVSRQIPPSAPLIGMNTTLPRLADRTRLQLISPASLAAARPGTFVLVDLGARANELVAPAAIAQEVDRMRRSGQWAVVAHRGSVWLLKRTGG